MPAWPPTDPPSGPERPGDLGRPLDPQVSAALQLPAGSDVAPLRAALVAVDRVHGDGTLRSIPVLSEHLTRGRQGEYRLRRDGSPVDIRVSSAARYPGLTLLHEIGHFLDHQALGQTGVFASTGHADLADWRTVARRSRAVGGLADLRRGAATLREATYLDYLQRDEELWARSYAQYVATRSAEPLLQGELVASRQRRPGTVYTPRQWGDDDFISIAEAIEDLFRRRGWIG